MDELLEEKDTTQIKIKAPKDEIVYIDMICKSYEGLAELIVSSEEKGVIYFNVTEGTRGEILDILKNLQKDYSLEILKK